MKFSFKLVVLSIILIALIAWYKFFLKDLPNEKINPDQLGTMELTKSNRDQLRLPDFELTNFDGSVITQNSLKGKWSVLYFGYAHCPDVCPIDMLKLADMIKLLEEKKLAIPAVFFVTLDYRRDTPTFLREYLPNFDKDFQGLSEKPSEIDKLVDFFNVRYGYSYYDKDDKPVSVKDYSNIPDYATEGYFVDHTDNFYVLDPDLIFRAYIGANKDPQAMMEDFSILYSSQEK